MLRILVPVIQYFLIFFFLEDELMKYLRYVSEISEKSTNIVKRKSSFVKFSRHNFWNLDININ